MLTQAKALATAIFLATALFVAFPAAAQPLSGTAEVSLGDPRAPLTIIEYASMSCPHCAEFHNFTLPKLKAEYIDTGKVRLIFREYPLDQPAVEGAILARCSGAQRYFPFLEVLFKNQATWVVATDRLARLRQIGQIGGLSAADFDACLADQTLRTAILNTRLEGERQFDVASTPTFIVGTAVIEGALPWELFKAAVEDALAGRPVKNSRGISSSAAGAAAGGEAFLYISLTVIALLIAAGGYFFFIRRPAARPDGRA